MEGLIIEVERLSYECNLCGIIHAVQTVKDIRVDFDASSVGRWGGRDAMLEMLHLC